jgi:hypothetical protein
VAAEGAGVAEGGVLVDGVVATVAEADGVGVGGSACP